MKEFLTILILGLLMALVNNLVIKLVGFEQFVISFMAVGTAILIVTTNDQP